MITGDHAATAGAIAGSLGIRGSGGAVSFGRGIRDGTMNVVFDSHGQKLPLLTLVSYGSITVKFAEIKKPPFDADGKRRELLQRLNAVSGVACLMT